jgi:tripartite-type tricarboxylate transporter receptor subunit TctC
MLKSTATPFPSTRDVMSQFAKPAEPTFSSGARQLLTVVLTMLSVAQAGAQSAYPTRSIRLVVPNSAGGAADAVGRLLAHGLSERLGRPVVVDNRPGAGTIIGTEIVARASPDGHTLLMSPTTLAINPASYNKLPYNALRDFAPISQIASVPSVLVVHPSVPANSVMELIALAKSRPGELLYASPGHGTIPHLTMELFASMAKIRMLHVPYKGAAPARVDLLAARVATTTIIAYVPDGKLRALGVTSAHRSAAAPDIPTISEAGLPGFELVQWYGLLAPADTSGEIIARLHKDTIAVLRTADMKEHLGKNGGEIVGSSPVGFGAFLKAETAKMANSVKAAGIQAE